jgi:hypothetical protein
MRGNEMAILESVDFCVNTGGVEISNGSASSTTSGQAGSPQVLGTFVTSAPFCGDYFSNVWNPSMSIRRARRSLGEGWVSIRG